MVIFGKEKVIFLEKMVFYLSVGFNGNFREYIYGGRNKKTSQTCYFISEQIGSWSPLQSHINSNFKRGIGTPNTGTTNYIDL